MTQPERQWRPPIDLPTPILGFPLGPSRPGQDIPDYGSMGRVKAIKERQRANGTTIRDPLGGPQLIKRRDYELRTPRTAE
jgi:hypothetical protein